MNFDSFHNLAMCSSTLLVILNKSKELELSKALLIYPLVMHKETLDYLAKKNTKKRTINSLLTINPLYFLNFNERFYNSLKLNIYSIQYLTYTKQIKFDKKLIINRSIKVENSLGERLKKIELASEKIIYLLNQPTEDIYLNLRIKL